MPAAVRSLFDLQVNGFAGVDFQRVEVTQSEVWRAVDALRAHQTHRILLTLISDEVDALCRKLEQFETFRRKDSALAETLCGYHLEGPFLSPLEGYRGAHSAAMQRAPSLAAFARMQQAAQGNVRLITLAPEWPTSADFIAEVTRGGVVVSLGHTAASDVEIDAAIAAGATLCTHLGNALPALLPRHDNVLQRLLARDELTACFIPDGVHLPPAVLRNLVRAKPAGKVILTTDATAAAAAPSGRYTLGELSIESHDGIVQEAGCTHFAGSSLHAPQGVENAAAWLGIGASEARALFSTSAAAPFGIVLPEIEPC